MTVDDPWGFGNSLEWATTCPPPLRNFDRMPRIRSERPAFDLKYGPLVADLGRDLPQRTTEAAAALRATSCTTNGTTPESPAAEGAHGAREATGVPAGAAVRRPPGGRAGPGGRPPAQLRAERRARGRARPGRGAGAAPTNAGGTRTATATDDAEGRSVDRPVRAALPSRGGRAPAVRCRPRPPGRAGASASPRSVGGPGARPAAVSERRTAGWTRVSRSGTPVRCAASRPAISAAIPPASKPPAPTRSTTTSRG